MGLLVCSVTTTTKTITMSGGLPRTFKAATFPFSHSRRHMKKAIEEHRKTPILHNAISGGRPDRPAAGLPPTAPTVGESCYIQQLFEAYGDHQKESVSCLADPNSLTRSDQHYNRHKCSSFLSCRVTLKFRPGYCASRNVQQFSKTKCMPVWWKSRPQHSANGLCPRNCGYTSGRRSTFDWQTVELASPKMQR